MEGSIKSSRAKFVATWDNVDEGGVNVKVTESELLRILNNLRPGGKATIERPVKLYEYDVFYGSEFIQQGWSQRSRVKAENHHQAVCEAASRSQHANGTRYLAIGAGPHPYAHKGDEEVVGRVFEIHQVRSASDAHFTSREGSMGTCHYVVEEIKVIPKRVPNYEPRD